MKPETKIWLANLLRKFGVPDIDEDRSNSNHKEERSRTDIDPVVEAPLGRRRRYPGQGLFWRGGRP
jgi:hypothetical protein